METNVAGKYFDSSSPKASTAKSRSTSKAKLKIKDFGLTLALLTLFALSVLGHFIFGFHAFNSERLEHGFAPLTSAWDYFQSGHFISSLSENMESEFLQMAVFVYLTVFLYQRGSAESKKPKDQETTKDHMEEQAEKDLSAIKKRTSKWAWTLYENSLTLSLLAIFIISFLMHAYGSYKLINDEHMMTHLPLISFGDIFSESEFWFESFQNWQSEFFSIAVMGLLSIGLRQKGSPQSKKLWDPTWKTGSD